MAAHVKRETLSGNFSIVAGHRIQITNTPIGLMTDRHDYPTPPSRGPAPLATVK